MIFDFFSDHLLTGNDTRLRNLEDNKQLFNLKKAWFWGSSTDVLVLF